MARSRQGGTRGFLRGRVANDLYQVTKDDKGRYIQLVRAVEESRVNNNTVAQAMARMQMSLCMGALASFKEIVDHSFEGVPYGMHSLSHFVSLNVPLLQADCAAHWLDGYLWDYPIKGISAVRAGSWLMSTGSLEMPASIVRFANDDYGQRVGWRLVLSTATPTMGTVKKALGLAANDYITHCAFGNARLLTGSRLAYSRCYLNPAFPDSAVVTVDNANRLFLYEGSVSCTVTWNAAAHVLDVTLQQPQEVGLQDYPVSCVIISRWNGRVWQRNNARMMPVPRFEDYANAWLSPSDVFSSWFSGYDPDINDDYPL